MSLSNLKLSIDNLVTCKILAAVSNFQIEHLTDLKAALLVVSSYLVNNIFNMAGDSTHYENVKLMNWKQEVLFCGKQLKDNT